MDKSAKETIQKLIDKYELAKKKGGLKKYTEEETKKGFIEPLFEALGWNISDKSEVSMEENISGDRVDYGFYISGRIKFYLEAKRISADLHKEEYANQAIKYSFNKGAVWAVLTDFESIKVFNCQDISKSLADKLYFEIPYNQLVERFDQLSQLSRESFEKGLIDKSAERVGKKFQKIPVSEILAKDLNKCRKILTDSLGEWNSIKGDLLDEGVQKLLDRLVFLRVAEDRGIEKPTLLPMLREWESSKTKNEIPFYKFMVDKFRELDKIYNSNLFTKHPFEDWDEYDGTTEKVIEILQGKEGYYEYDFKVMPADVLGSVYESYLGHKLSQSKKETTIGKDSKKRKEQGIYYTPRYIVDYIVENSLGPVLDECKSVDSIKKIRVLDPACGSGSFLLKAVEMIYQKYYDLGYKDKQLTKIQILKENIYGVDLDEQAVEIARLNLLIGALNERMILPSLAGNIKNGNSLISGTEEELKKHFGKNWKNKKPFNWQEEFPEVFQNGGHRLAEAESEGGFDVIIGNPPYVRNRDLNLDDKKFFDSIFYSASGQYDIYQLFFEKSLNLLRENGKLGFITSNKYTIADYGKKLREFILDNSKIVSIVDVSNLDVFKEASTYPYIIILEKTKSNSKHIINGYKAENEAMLEGSRILINQDEIKSSPTKNFTIKKEIEFLSNLENDSEKLGDIAVIKETIHTGNIRNKLIVDEKIDDSCKKLLAGKDCHRYWFQWNGKYIRYDKNLIDKSKKEYANLPDKKYFEEPKILLREIASNIECYLDNEKYYTLNKVYAVQLKEDQKYNLYYILALLNSRLLSYYFHSKFEEAHVRGGYLQFKKIYTSQIPIFKADKKEQEKLSKLAQKMLDLNKEFQELSQEEEGSNKWQKLKDEIEKTDKKIDEEVYKLYGLSDKEIKIVEGDRFN